MKMLRMFIAAAVVSVSALFCGCVSENYPVANPNNVYRLSENTPLSVLIQKEDGSWVKARGKIVIPMGYYIGSGIE